MCWGIYPAAIHVVSAANKSPLLWGRWWTRTLGPGFWEQTLLTKLDNGLNDETKIHFPTKWIKTSQGPGVMQSGIAAFSIEGPPKANWATFKTLLTMNFHYVLSGWLEDRDPYNSLLLKRSTKLSFPVLGAFAGTELASFLRGFGSFTLKFLRGAW